MAMAALPRWARTFLAWATAWAALSPGVGGVPEAVDSHDTGACRCWAAQGDCEANAEFMQASCAGSCARHATTLACASKVADLETRLTQAGGGAGAGAGAGSEASAGALKHVAELEARLEKGEADRQAALAEAKAAVEGMSDLEARLKKVQEEGAAAAAAQQESAEKLKAAEAQLRASGEEKAAAVAAAAATPEKGEAVAAAEAEGAENSKALEALKTQVKKLEEEKGAAEETLARLRDAEAQLKRGEEECKAAAAAGKAKAEDLAVQLAKCSEGNLGGLSDLATQLAAKEAELQRLASQEAEARRGREEAAARQAELEARVGELEAAGAAQGSGDAKVAELEALLAQRDAELAAGAAQGSGDAAKAAELEALLAQRAAEQAERTAALERRLAEREESLAAAVAEAAAASEAAALAAESEDAAVPIGSCADPAAGAGAAWAGEDRLAELCATLSRTAFAVWSEEAQPFVDEKLAPAFRKAALALDPLLRELRLWAEDSGAAALAAEHQGPLLLLAGLLAAVGLWLLFRVVLWLAFAPLHLCCSLCCPGRAGKGFGSFAAGGVISV